jgi:hypothetical protein
MLYGPFFGSSPNICRRSTIGRPIPASTRSSCRSSRSLVGSGPAALISAGLGWLGVSALTGQWQMLVLIGAVLGLVALGLYFHSFYLVAVVIDVVIVAMVWGRLVAAR